MHHVDPPLKIKISTEKFDVNNFAFKSFINK